MKYTKWIVLYQYNCGYGSYIIFVRKNKKTGMMYFKTKRVNKPLTDCNMNICTNATEILEGIENEH